MQAAKALARLPIWADSFEPWLVVYEKTPENPCAGLTLPLAIVAICY